MTTRNILSLTLALFLLTATSTAQERLTGYERRARLQPVGGVIPSRAYARPTASTGVRRAFPRHWPDRVQPAPRRVWVPGHFETVRRRVWIPERVERVWVEPTYEFRLVCGIRLRILTRDGHYRRIVHPGHFQSRNEQRWVSGRWRVT